MTPHVNSFIFKQAKYFCCLFSFVAFIYIFRITSPTRSYSRHFANLPFAPNKRRLLRIAQISHLMESTPPKNYGGTERIASYLTEEFVRRGHEVTLFAANDSVTSAKLVSIWPALKHNPTDQDPIYSWIMAQVRENASKFDIVHVHSDLHFDEVYEIFKKNKTTLMVTIHGLMSWYPSFGGAYNDLPLISISYEQRKNSYSRRPNFIANVYHGIPEDLYKFVEKPMTKEPYLAFLGRINPVKMPDWAIKIAIKANIKLKIGARAESNHYWLNQIKPMIDENKELVEYMGELNDSQKNELLGNAMAFIFPIDWPEPFGMVMIEAMACGTPVIGRRRGSVPEIVEEGVTGFLFDTIDQAVEAVKKVNQIDRKGVRKTFEARFTATKMADEYEKIYNSRLGGCL